MLKEYIEFKKILKETEADSDQKIIEVCQRVTDTYILLARHFDYSTQEFIKKLKDDMK
jgi:hypothetical protein